MRQGYRAHCISSPPALPLPYVLRPRLGIIPVGIASLWRLPAAIFLVVTGAATDPARITKLADDSAVCIRYAASLDTFEGKNGALPHAC